VEKYDKMLEFLEIPKIKFNILTCKKLRLVIRLAHSSV
jgi:hypothetical protein